MAKHPKEEKTNVVRILEAAGIPCTAYEVPLPKGEVPDGVTAAKLLGKPPEQVFKTLVAQGPKGEHFVFVIPVAETLDLKKAAKAAGVKSVSMLPQKQLLPLTGYVHGGCSPVGMAKAFPILPRKSSWWTPWCVPPGRWASRWRWPPMTSSPW